jgi:hypothetical protein
LPRSFAHTLTGNRRKANGANEVFLKRKRYTDEFRASAVLMLEAAGYPDQVGALTRVSAHLNVPHPTLIRWFRGQSNPPPYEIVQDKKRDFLAQLRAIRGLAADKIIAGIDDYDPRDLTGLLKISAELSQLFEGKPTAINEERTTDARSKLNDLISRHAPRDEAGEDTEQTE